MQDFNIRADSEITYTLDPVVTDRLQLFLQELDVLFSLDRFSTLSYPEIDNGIEKLLWSTSASSDTIRANLTEAIRTSCMMHYKFEWSVKVSLVKGALRDIIIIDVDITTDNGKQQVQYMFK